MRFYLNVPLVVGYVLMATTACLGMLQLVAARGGYAGLSLFCGEQRRGVRVGAGLTVGALLAYVLFAPEILTPGPAGTEVAEMFALCALAALIITLFGADRRLQRARRWNLTGDQTLSLGGLSATLYRPASNLSGNVPALVILPDPTGFVTAPQTLIEALSQVGIAVLALDAQEVTKGDAPLSRRTLLGHLSTALVQLGQHPEVDPKRTGLLGLGLGGDAVLRAAAVDPQVKGTIAVLPVSGTPYTPAAVGPGLHWLREISYRQVWTWRRRWPTFYQAVADLAVDKLGQTTFAGSIAVVCASDGVITVQSLGGDEQPVLSSQRHFTLLENARVRQFVASWLQQKLNFSGNE